MTIKNFVAAAVLIALPITQQVQADFLGALDGRGANLSEQADMAIEVNHNSTGDYDWSGLRINHKVNDDLIVFADASKVAAKDLEIRETVKEKFDGQAFGGGFVYYMPDLLSGYQTSLKGAYHTGTLPDSGGLTFDGAAAKFDHKITSMSAKMLISPEGVLLDNGTTWYASVGYSKIDRKVTGPVTLEFESESGLSAGIGLVMPLSFGEAYIGVESIGGPRIAGAGIRYTF